LKIDELDKMMRNQEKQTPLGGEDPNLRKFDVCKDN